MRDFIGKKPTRVAGTHVVTVNSISNHGKKKNRFFKNEILKLKHWQFLKITRKIIKEMMVSLVTFSYRLCRYDKNEGMCMKELRLKRVFFLINSLSYLYHLLLISTVP